MTKNCTFEYNEAGERRCTRCGRKVLSREERVYTRCRIQSRGLGDWIAFALGMYGITPKRIERITGRPCGCKERQEAANRWWWWITGQRSRPEPVESPRDSDNTES